MSTIRGLVKHVDRRLFKGLFRDLEHYRARRGPYLRAPSNSYVVYPFLPVGRSRERFRQLCDKYGSDKSSMREELSLPYSWVAHRYDFLYAALFPTEQNRKDVRFVFEVGLGSTDPEIASNMGPGGCPRGVDEDLAGFFSESLCGGCRCRRESHIRDCSNQNISGGSDEK